MYKLFKAWAKRNSFSSFNNSNGAERTLDNVHDFDNHSQKIRLCYKKKDDLGIKIVGENQYEEFMRETSFKIESLRTDMEIKLSNMYESLKQDLSKDFEMKKSTYEKL